MQSIFQEKDRLDENLFPLYSIFIMEIKRKLISCQLIRIFILEINISNDNFNLLYNYIFSIKIYKNDYLKTITLPQFSYTH